MLELADAAVTPADGLAVNFHGRLEPTAAVGRPRLLDDDVIARGGGAHPAPADFDGDDV